MAKRKRNEVTRKAEAKKYPSGPRVEAMRVRDEENDIIVLQDKCHRDDKEKIQKYIDKCFTARGLKRNRQGSKK